MTAIKFGTDGWRGIIADDFTYANARIVAHATHSQEPEWFTTAPVGAIQ